MSRIILTWRNRCAMAEAAAGAVMFMGKPERWYKDPHWFCGNGHVSRMYLSGDDGDRCLVCQLPVLMGPAISEEAFLPILRELCRFKLFFRSSRTE